MWELDFDINMLMATQSDFCFWRFYFEILEPQLWHRGRESLVNASFQEDVVNYVPHMRRATAM